jgi:thiamine biosynthesis lipoprotein
LDVSPELVDVVRRALEVAADSDGAFDPTISPLVGLWNFGADAEDGDLPTDEDIDNARRHVDYRLIETRSEPPALRKTDPLVRLDLSAIAKGHGVDRVAALLNEAGFSAWMVEIGGEVRTQGTKPDGSPWRIGIEQPVAGRRILDSALDLGDSALATSGDYRNFFESNGVRYQHTINPATGRPVTHSLASVTVLADDCMTADAWATTLMVLGPEAGADWAEDRGIRAYFILHARDGFSTAQTTGFPALESLDVAATGDPPSVPDSDHWTTFLLALVVFGVAVIGLAIGVILSNRRLRGSCGGLAGMQDEHGRPVCESCTTPASDCDEFRKRAASAAEANATESDFDGL